MSIFQVLFDTREDDAWLAWKNGRNYFTYLKENSIKNQDPIKDLDPFYFNAVVQVENGIDVITTDIYSLVDNEMATGLLSLIGANIYYFVNWSIIDYFNQMATFYQQTGIPEFNDPEFIAGLQHLSQLGKNQINQLGFKPLSFPFISAQFESVNLTPEEYRALAPRYRFLVGPVYNGDILWVNNIMKYVYQHLPHLSFPFITSSLGPVVFNEYREYVLNPKTNSIKSKFISKSILESNRETIADTMQKMENPVFHTQGFKRGIAKTLELYDVLINEIEL